MAGKEYNATKLHREMEAAGLVISGVTGEGRVDWQEEPSEEMISLAERVKAGHDPFDAAEMSRQAMHEKGIDAEKMINALWEKVMEGKPEAAEEIQLIKIAAGIVPRQGK